MEDNTILVVGGAGYIGSYINQMLDAKKYKTVVLDNLSRGSRAAVTKGIFIQGDLNDPVLLKKIFSSYKIDAVMHFAASIDVGESVVNPLKYYENNVCATINLLKTMLAHQVNRFIFSSSAAVYGLPQTDRITEETPCYPINPYGQSKLMIETVLHDLYAANGLQYCALRYFNATGGDPSGKFKNYNSKRTESNLIPLLFKSLQEKTVIRINGTDYPTPDGTCIRDYIHIEDLGNAHLAALEKMGEDGCAEAYNLGNGQGYSIRQVIAAVETVTGMKIRWVEGARRPGDPPSLIAVSEKAQKQLHWKPQYSNLEQMIAHAWQALDCDRREEWR